MIKIKALVLEDKMKLVMRDEPIPVPKDNEVLIKTKAATICTSDVNDIKSNPFGIVLPMIMGHEGSGVITAVGKDVTDFKIGDEVTSHPVISCGTCVSCKRGLSHLCDDMEHLGINHGGVFAEFYTIRQDRIRKKPSGMTFPTATLMEPLCVCIEAVTRGNVNENSNVLVIGDGPFGVMIANICTARGNKNVILLGRHEYRMSQAPNAVHLNEKECGNVNDEILRLTNGEGIDSAIVCVGTGEAVDIAIEALRSRGTVCIFSAVHDKYPIDLFKVHVKELNICGSCNDTDFLDEAVEMLKSGKFDGVVTHEIPFDEYEKAFDIAMNKKNTALKVSMIFD